MNADMETTVGKLAWHVHHNKLCEVLIEPIENRIEYIKLNKPPGEIEIRLRLLKIMRGPLSDAIEQAYWAWKQADQAFEQADQAFEQADQAFEQADQARKQAYQAWKQAYQARDQAAKAFEQAAKAFLQLPELAALHEQECPHCPWDGKTIFPTAKKAGEA